MRRHASTAALVCAVALAVLATVGGTAWLGGPDSSRRETAAVTADPAAPATGFAATAPVAPPSAPAPQLAAAARPGDGRTTLRAADRALARGRLDLAERLCRRLLAESPGLVPARVRLALVRHARGDSSGARRALAAVVAAHPDDQEARYCLAVVCYALGDLEAALAEWRAAAALDPDSALGRRSRSFVSLLTGGD